MALHVLKIPLLSADDGNVFGNTVALCALGAGFVGDVCIAQGRMNCGQRNHSNEALGTLATGPRDGLLAVSPREEEGKPDPRR